MLQTEVVQLHRINLWLHVQQLRRVGVTKPKPSDPSEATPGCTLSSALVKISHILQSHRLLHPGCNPVVIYNATSAPNRKPAPQL